MKNAESKFSVCDDGRIGLSEECDVIKVLFKWETSLRVQSVDMRKANKCGLSRCV